jgi:hypothetical protein
MTREIACLLFGILIGMIVHRGIEHIIPPVNATDVAHQIIHGEPK